MAATLDRQEQALDDEYERRRQLLLTVLPPHLVRDDGVVSDTGEYIDAATVIGVAIDPDHGEVDTSDDLTDALSTVTATAERLATERGIDRIRVAADRSLFVAGSGSGTGTTEPTMPSVRLDPRPRDSNVRSHDAGSRWSSTSGISTGQSPLASWPAGA